MNKDKMIIFKISTEEKQLIKDYADAQQIPMSYIIRTTTRKKLDEEYVPELDLYYSSPKNELIGFNVSKEFRDELKDFCKLHYGNNKYMSSYIRKVVLDSIK